MHRIATRPGVSRARRWVAGSVVAALVAGAPLATLTPAQAAAPAPVVVAPTAKTAVAKTSKVDGKISRTEVMTRARAWLNHKEITYSMTGTHPGPKGKGRYRRDCSGFVSMALHLNDKGGGRNTATLLPLLKKIKKSQLKTGDLIGKLGPGTLRSAGHVQIFVKWQNKAKTKLQVAEQSGGSIRYPHYQTYSWSYINARYKTYRYKKITG